MVPRNSSNSARYTTEKGRQTSKKKGVYVLHEEEKSDEKNNMRSGPRPSPEGTGTYWQYLLLRPVLLRIL